MRATVLAGTWVIATVAALAIARWTKVGPNVFKVSARHGVHAGDVAAFGVAFLVAAVATIVLLRRWRGSGPRTREGAAAR